MNGYIFRAFDEKQNYMAYQGTPDLETLYSFMFHFGNSKNIMLYSGFDDSFGAKIFDGDIITTHKNYNYYVKFEKGSFYCYHLTHYDIDGTPLRWGLLSRAFELLSKNGGHIDEIKVIDNIHENKLNLYKKS